MNCLNKKSIFQLLQDGNSETDISELLRVMLYSVTVYFLLMRENFKYVFVMNAVHQGK